MVKITPNVLVRSIDKDTIAIIQSKGEYDYREFLKISNDEHLLFCVAADKFMAVLSEGVKEIVQEITHVILKTSNGEYTLPIFRERGVLVSEPEVNLPNSQIKESWEDDFSKKSVNTKTGNYLNLSYLLVTIGPDFLFRGVNNIFEKYGKGKGVFSILPPQYSLIQKMGKVKLNLFETGELQVLGENQEVRVKRTALVSSLEKIEDIISEDQLIVTMDLSKVKLKTMDKFILERIYMEVKTGSVTFVSETARKTIEIPELVVNNPFDLMLNSKDLKYLLGKVSVYPYNFKNRQGHLLVSIEGDKTTYIITQQAPSTRVW